MTIPQSPTGNMSGRPYNAQSDSENLTMTSINNQSIVHQAPENSDEGVHREKSPCPKRGGGGGRHCVCGCNEISRK